MLLLIDYINAHKHFNPSGVVTVFISNTDIPEGAIIYPEMLTKREIPKEFAVPGSITNRSLIEGCRAARPIGKGEPFTKLSTGREKAPSLARYIPEGFRAFTLEISKPHTIAEIRPGNLVDVIAASTSPESALTILRERLVLSVGAGCYYGSDGHQTEETPNICLLVTPQEAEILAKASAESEISVSLCPDQPRR